MTTKLSYRQLQAQLKSYKADGLTTIKLTSKYNVLMAEYERIQSYLNQPVVIDDYVDQLTQDLSDNKQQIIADSEWDAIESSIQEAIETNNVLNDYQVITDCEPLQPIVIDNEPSAFTDEEFEEIKQDLDNNSMTSTDTDWNSKIASELSKRKRVKGFTPSMIEYIKDYLSRIIPAYSYMNKLPLSEDLDKYTNAYRRQGLKNNDLHGHSYKPEYFVVNNGYQVNFTDQLDNGEPIPEITIQVPHSVTLTIPSTDLAIHSLKQKLKIA